MAWNPGQTDGYNPNVDVSVVEAKVLSILRSKFLGIGIAATSRNPQAHKAGSAIYRVPEMIQSQEYTYATRNDDPDAPSMGDIEVSLNVKRTAKYELETFDGSVLEMNGAIEAEFAQSLSLIILAEIDAEFIKVAADKAIETGNYVVNSTFGSARTQTDIDTMFYDLVDLVGDLEGTVDKEQIGVNKEEVVSIVNTKAKARFIKGGNGGDRNEADRQSGMIENINGIALREHPFIGKEITAGASFAKDKAYNFSNIGAIVVHTEAVAMPFALNSITPTVGENSGNPKMIAKYRYGKHVVRPKLVKAILLAEPTPAEAKKAEPTPAEAKKAEAK